MNNLAYNTISRDPRKVCGYPVSILDPYNLTKTILFAMLLAVNNSFADDFMNEIFSALDSFNKNGIVIIEYSKSRPETGEEARARWEQEDEDAKAVALNKREVKEGIYYVDGRWISKGSFNPVKPLSESDLKDSDDDGYDDYTEYTHGTNWKDQTSIPAIRQGNNRKVFR